MKKDWEVKKLGDLCELVTKGTTPTSLGHMYTEEGINFIKVESIDSNKNFLPNKFAHINEDCHNALKRSQLKKNDILFSIAGALGRIALVNENILPANTNQALAIIRLRKGILILPEYTALALNIDLISEQINKCKGGVAQQNLSLQQVKNFVIPVPPLPEQQRIVELIDKAFKAIDKAKENAEKNLQNAKEVFESYLQSIFSNPGEEWVDKNLGEVCNLYQGLAINAKTKHLLVEKSEFPLLRIKDLKNDSIEQFIDPIYYPKNSLVQKDDLIYTRTGQIGLVFTGKYGVLHNNSFKIVPDASLLKRYLYWFLHNPSFKSKIIRLSSKTAQPDITHKVFKEQIISVPSISGQKQIAKKLDKLYAETINLENIYQQKLSNLDELKKSILKKAFDGEL